MAIRGVATAPPSSSLVPPKVRPITSIMEEFWKRSFVGWCATDRTPKWLLCRLDIPEGSQWFHHHLRGNSGYVRYLDTKTALRFRPRKCCCGDRHEEPELVAQELAVGCRRSLPEHSLWNVAHAESHENLSPLRDPAQTEER
ncbi:hypothetical protein AGOR_G00099360 [Albula goreensis]|uniref:Uncharacterized protein n=1 Tax=Albula goreensis TaxID=1534307 RepID=A0A8T3DLF1_9TELE|nr:hypothetical protein AGOR_G00099360 [Albula goreensis]